MKNSNNSVYKKPRHEGTSWVMFILSILWVVPLLFILMNSFKTMKEVITAPIDLPTSISLANYETVWTQVNYPRLFLNSTVVLIISETAIVLLCAMCGFWLQRNSHKKSSKFLSKYFLLSMFIPFQAIMIGMIALFSSANLTNDYTGLIISNIGLSASMAIFLFYGYSQQLPKELDEAAAIDGASPLRTFFSIIFPLMKPITSSVLILTALYTWNDYLKPLLLIKNKSYYTFPVGTASVVYGQYFTRYNLAVTALVLSAIPMIIAFIFLQKRIVSGVIAGSTKG